MRAKTPVPLLRFCFENLLDHDPPPWTPHFFQFFFSILDHRSPLLYFFPLLYYCVPLYIFTVFVHIFSTLKTTAAFNEEPEKENLACKAEENGKIIAKNSRISGTNGVIFAYFCSQSTKSDICSWEITSRHEWKPTERIG